MHTPAAALAWEIWRRHRPRVMAVIGFILAFALVYPKLCAVAGFNPDSADALGEFAGKFVPMSNGGPTTLRVVRILCIMFLTGGPMVTMFLSLLCVTWMFTFIEFDPKNKNRATFPGRLFTLPISTSFLFWWLFLSGLAAVVVLYESWIHFVRLPHLDVFGEYQQCFAWMTLLALAQGIFWALAAWPITRALVLIAVLFCFLGSAVQRYIFESPMVLPTLFLLGALLARAGLQKMRHGQWQGWTWKVPLPAMLADRGLGGPKHFASPAQAQLWFEWRRFARRLCFFAAGLAIIPVALHLLLRVVAGLGPLQDNTVLVFAVCLISVPVCLHFCFSVSSSQTDLPFLMIRPVTNGEMVMATLKAAGISAALSWVAVFTALCAMPLLGDFPAVMRNVSVPPGCQAAIVIFLTWRIVAANLCFVLTGNRWIAGAPVLIPFALWAGAVLLFGAQNGPDWGLFAPFIPSLLACLVAVKFLLAFVAFRVSLHRRLLAPSSLLGYLAVWIVLVAVLLTLAVVLFHPGTGPLLPLSLSVVLLVPLARIGFCPMGPARNRHT